MADPSAPTPVPVALQARREQTISALCAHFANDSLTVEEFEQRLDVATRAEAAAQLDSLLTDLPALPAPATSATNAAAQAPPAVHTRQHQTFVALMGGVVRRGRWQPAQKTFAIAMMGGVELDFRDVQLPPGETEVTVFCMMGGVEVIVPPGTNVDCDGIAIMGGFEHLDYVPAPGHPNAPVLRINGFAMMGGVEVQVRNPGESPKDARRRVREERRRLRDEYRRR